MTLEVKHSTVIDGVAYPDDPTKPIGTNEWNATHTLQMASGYLLGRASSGAGAVEELPPGSVATLLSSVPVKTPSTTVANLPSAATAGAGARMLVTDASGPTFNSFQAIVVGGGPYIVPVYSDGTNWRMG